MEMTKNMIEIKFQPKGTAKSNSPFLIANSIGFDSIKMLNKMEEDKKIRQERRLRIAEEIKKEQQIIAKKAQDERILQQEYDQSGASAQATKAMPKIQVDDQSVMIKAIGNTIDIFGDKPGD